MPDYKELYFTLFARVATAIEFLQDAQREIKPTIAFLQDAQRETELMYALSEPAEIRALDSKKRKG